MDSIRLSRNNSNRMQSASPKARQQDGGETSEQEVKDRVSIGKGDTSRASRSRRIQKKSQKTAPRETPGTKKVPLTILHTNDLHGHAEPFKEEGKMVGGIAHLAEKINIEREKDPDHTLLLDAGDTIQGAPLSDYFKGMPMVETMSKMGYDVMVPGNHDFDYGLEALGKRLKKTKATVLGANLVVKNKSLSLEGKVKPYVIKNIDGIKVGIVGLLTPESLNMIRDKSELKMIDILSPESTLEKVLPELKREGADTIILLSHLGIDKDEEVAQKFQEIDVIVGGHTHTSLDKPKRCGKTIIVQGGCYGRELGKAELVIDRESMRVEVRNYKLLPIESGKIDTDSEVEKIIEKYEARLGPRMNETIGTLKHNLTQRDYHTHREESDLGDLVTDLIRRHAGADIGFLNSSAMRCNLFKGKLKVGDIYSLFPWDHDLATVRLKGRHIRRLIEEGLGNLANGVAFSGLKAVIDTSKPSGQQVLALTEDDGTSIEPDREYTIAAEDYVVEGNMGLSAMKKARGRKDLGDFKEKIIHELKKLDEIAIKKDGRLINKASRK